MNKLIDEIYELKSLINIQKQNIKRMERIKMEVDLTVDSLQSNLKLIDEQYQLIKEMARKEG